jgi:hypothetical protein
MCRPRLGCSPLTSVTSEPRPDQEPDQSISLTATSPIRTGKRGQDAITLSPWLWPPRQPSWAGVASRQGNRRVGCNRHDEWDPGFANRRGDWKCGKSAHDPRCSRPIRSPARRSGHPDCNGDDVRRKPAVSAGSGKSATDRAPCRYGRRFPSVKRRRMDTGRRSM